MILSKGGAMQTTAFGNDGESLAKEYLMKKGYRFIRRNFKSAHGEIDLIMEDEGTLVFVEVKSRHNRRYGEPVESVRPVKQQHIRYTAKMYLLGRRIEGRRIRFDVVEILAEPGGAARYRHIKNAF